MVRPIRTAPSPNESPESDFARRVSAERRKRRGQFFTPPAVAEAMVRWAAARRPATFLDPAVGPGIFLAALRAVEGDGRRIQALAYDVDSYAIALARERLGEDGVRRGAGRRARGIEFRCQDFLAAEIDERFDAIVANPPYIRHHEAKLAEPLWRRFDEQFGVHFSRLTNVYALFLLKISRLLSPSGRAAVLTPTEFLNADFGRAVKAALLRTPAFAGFIVFDYTASIFDGLMTTATITLFDAARANEDIALARTCETVRLGDCLELFNRQPRRDFLPSRDRKGAVHISADVNRSLTVAARKGQVAARGLVVIRARREALDPSRKWSTSAVQLGVPGGCAEKRLSARRRFARAPLRPLGDVARCMRGIATGANGFFTLSDEEVERWKLPRALLRPCVTKARDAPGRVFAHEDFERLRRAGRKVWLLDVTPRTRRRAAKYLEHGESLGVHRRYLTRHRRHWYLSERREPADLWVTTFGRGRLRFVHNAAGVLSLTAFHAVYLRPEHRRWIPMLLDYLCSAEFDARCAAEHRVYGDGLLKLEPKDVERLPVPDFDASARENRGRN